jgi:nucleoside-diphosphate-sugar epimerase
MSKALIGSSGFVGTTLLGQFGGFSHCYRSSNIESIRGETFDLVVCAGAPAQKWIANADPDGDRANLDRLWESLQQLRCRRFVLISTVDVYPSPTGVDELTHIDPQQLQAYGRHRYRLENRVRSLFPVHHVMRLPGLVGKGLRKNALFDLKHGNQVDRIDPRGRMQFYDMSLLWGDVQSTIAAGLSVVNLAAEPLLMGDVARCAFEVELNPINGRFVPDYRMETNHAACFGTEGRYRLSRAQSMEAIIDYARSADLPSGAPPWQC